jgi:hypothetical protein
MEGAVTEENLRERDAHNASLQLVFPHRRKSRRSYWRKPSTISDSSTSYFKATTWPILWLCCRIRKEDDGVCPEEAADTFCILQEALVNSRTEASTPSH